MLSSSSLESFVSPSAYDTAWTAMVPHPERSDLPMFLTCLEWILHNQRQGGSWGEPGRRPTIHSLTETLACMVALKVWKVGATNVYKGLDFIHANTEKLLVIKKHDDGGHPLRWFAIVFPGMIELALANGLDVFPGGFPEVVRDIFVERQKILETWEEEQSSQKGYNPPLETYLEALPITSFEVERVLKEYQSQDGSLFQSPSATARAYIISGDDRCMHYLRSMVRRCAHGAVPHVYPVDEELVKLCLVDHLERLGLADHFADDIEHALHEVHREWLRKEPQEMGGQPVPLQIFKDSLAFRLLRMHGYQVSPGRLCWFLCDKDALTHIEDNYTSYLSSMYNIYRAAHVIFPGEDNLERVGSFARRLLEMGASMDNIQDGVVILNNFNREIEHELSLPWLARMDNLEHRMGIEECGVCDLWMGKASSYRLTCLDNNSLLKLAKENYNFRQSLYRNELEEVKRWSKKSGLCDIGFGREKTEYCYFAVAACLPDLSDVRMVAAKSAILIVVADDFFDIEGSLEDLHILIESVQRWEGGGLSGHSKIIFDALNDLVDDVASKAFDGRDIQKRLHDLWKRAFESWMKEATWCQSGHVPSMGEYLKVGMTSVGVEAIVHSACSLIDPDPHLNNMRITELLMVTTRLLNDTQTYQKEIEQGKLNMVSLYMKENPELGIHGSIADIQTIADNMKKEFLELALLDKDDLEMSKACKMLHLSILKIFQMFYNSTNAFDSLTMMLDNIYKVIYEPLEVDAQLGPHPSCRPHLARMT